MLCAQHRNLAAMSVRSAPSAAAMRGPAVLRGPSSVVTPARRSVQVYAGKPTLIYFPIPGRAEVARLCFTIGGIDYEDKHIDFATWPELKPTTPFGQVPVLQVDSQMIAQSAAIDHYAAKLAGLVPTDPLAAALADQAYFFVEDVLQVLVPTFRIKDPEEQKKARQELAQGALKEKLALLNKLVESRPGKYIAGDSLSLGDLAIFNNLSMMRSGLMAGLPADILDGFPALKSFRNDIASLPAVSAHYAKAQDDTRKNGYTPDV